MCNKEDLVFQKGSELARAEGIPRIYISANSGARIGLADEVKAKFKISWKGTGANTALNYLYLVPDDYHELNKVPFLHPFQPLRFFLWFFVSRSVPLFLRHFTC